MPVYMAIGRRSAQRAMAALFLLLAMPSGDARAAFGRLAFQIPRAAVARLSDIRLPVKQLVPIAEGVHDRVVLEIMRGCPNACRFCQAGSTRLPVRTRSVDEIVRTALDALEATGYHEVSLLSLSTSDYPDLDKLIARLSAELTPRNISISLPSLRVDSQLQQLPKLTSAVRKGGLTIAAEAGTDRMRRAIRKNITEENMLAGVQAAYEAGWQRVKVYFMAGLPGERPEDLYAIFDLCRRLSWTRKAVDNHKGAIGASVSWAVPKPHTPMQWCAMQTEDYFWSVRNRLRELSDRTPVSFRFHRIERSLIEGLLCCGDRRVGAVIERAWRNGARLDAWDEHWDYAHWQEALEQTGVDFANVIHRELTPGDPLPWSHIVCHRGEKTLRAEHDRMMAIVSEEG